MAKNKEKATRRSPRRKKSSATPRKVFENELEQKLKEIKRHALVIAIRNKPETRLLDVVELATKLGLGKDITIGDLQAGAHIPIEATEQLALPPKQKSERRSGGKAKAQGGKFGGEDRKKTKEKIVRMIAKQKEPISARDLRFALNHPQVDSPKMTALLQELVANHEIAYEGNANKRVYYALK